MVLYWFNRKRNGEKITPEGMNYLENTIPVSFAIKNHGRWRIKREKGE
jgi:hypothetical protein